MGRQVKFARAVAGLACQREQSVQMTVVNHPKRGKYQDGRIHGFGNRRAAAAQSGGFADQVPEVFGEESAFRTGSFCSGASLAAAGARGRRLQRARPHTRLGDRRRGGPASPRARKFPRHASSPECRFTSRLGNARIATGTFPNISRGAMPHAAPPDATSPARVGTAFGFRARWQWQVVPKAAASTLADSLGLSISAHSNCRIGTSAVRFGTGAIARRLSNRAIRLRSHPACGT